MDVDQTPWPPEPDDIYLIFVPWRVNRSAIRIRQRRQILVERIFPTAEARTLFVNRWLALQYMGGRKMQKMRAENLRGIGQTLMGLGKGLGKAWSTLGHRRKRRRKVNILPWDV